MNRDAYMDDGDVTNPHLTPHVPSALRRNMKFSPLSSKCPEQDIKVEIQTGEGDKQIGSCNTVLSYLFVTYNRCVLSIL